MFTLEKITSELKAHKNKKLSDHDGYYMSPNQSIDDAVKFIDLFYNQSRILPVNYSVAECVVLSYPHNCKVEMEIRPLVFTSGNYYPSECQDVSDAVSVAAAAIR